MAESENTLLKELKNTFKYDTFKSELQRKAVKVVYEGATNVFVSMPTGAGKSLCYQLPAILSSGVTLVLSPLLALIQNQVQQLKAKGVNAVALNSKTSSLERKQILADLHLKTPTIKLLYITPELAATPHFRSQLDALYKFKKLSLIAVDEAHCVSEWGHDFRPDYLKLGELRGAYSLVPWLALTATATPHVQKDVIKSLQMKQPVAVFKATCFRHNLFYDIKYKDTLKDPLQDLYEFVCMALGLRVTTDSSQGRRGHTGCGIVYCRTRDGCTMLAGRLSSKGIKAKAYHAGLQATQRSEVQQQWMDGVVPVIVATISFGMGVDKSNVRFVSHWTMPKSVEAYYQESGRAGRDGEQSYCRMYYSKSDRDDLLFLIKREAKKKKSNGYSVSGHGTVKEATQKTFQAMVKFCEEAQCRHSAIAEYFNDPKPQCGRSCDYCKDPTATKEHAKNGNFLSVCKKANRFGSVAGAYGRPDSSLYGGGRWGHKRDEDGDSSDGEGGRRKRKHGDDGLFDDFFEAEFRKRRKAGSVEREVPGENCKLREADNFSRVPKLELKVREHCLGQLTKALEENASAGGVGSSAPSDAAITVEHGLFCSSKIAQSYKLAHSKKMKEIKAMTQDGTVHPSLTAAASGAQSSSDTEAPPNSSRDMPLFAGFMKASRLVAGEHSSSCPIPSGEVSSGGRQEVSPHLPSDTKKSSPIKTTTVSSCDGSLGLNVDATGTLPANKTSANPSTQDTSLVRTHDTSLVRTHDTSLVRTHDTSLVRTHDTSLVRTVNGSFVSASCLLPVAKVLPRNGLSHDNDTSCFVSPPLLIAKSSLELKMEPKCLESYNTGGGSCNAVNGATEEGGQDGRREGSDCGERGGEKGKGEGGRSDAAETSSKSQQDCSNRKISNLSQVIASKNSLLGLDIQDYDDISRAHTSSSLKGQDHRSKRRQVVADTVVKALGPYYKDKRIASKELFKKFAKKMAQHLMSIASADSDTANLSRETKALLQRFFAKFSQVATEGDLTKLNQLIAK